jgi:DNA-binding transcriptional LysR family regulator
VNISEFDANLFLVLDAVLAEKSATRAARRLHVTPSAISNALARLRDRLGDPLVVRNGRGLTPTPFALTIAPRVSGIVQEMSAIVARDRRFDPASETGELTLACTDDQEVSDIPRILRLFAQRLPRATLRVVTVERLVFSNGLKDATVQAAIAPSGIVGPGLRHESLYDADGVVVVRQGNPLIGRRMTREHFQSIPHVDVRVAGDEGIGHQAWKEQLARLGLGRRVIMIVPHFLAAAAAVSETDYIAAVPRRFAEAVAKLLPLRIRILKMPFPPPKLPLSLVWHDCTHAHPASIFFRQLIIQGLRTSRSASQRTTDSP